ncbi:HlyD family efflux transporter periplasmic adaptor subunit [Cupriavidus sp. SW-Y-13]|uniref:HlyD family secretion protein n=1 Tax=Cupriavidus sp. SW-Y-13 TaxID=2653854 RepID=UPI0013662B7A|nr:HlyD family efflux transporter periplasmic adaptor subunit [Cupriavidus sp. SW-Y-13]MWL89215.1 HlyD family efflux transporter periplasmic adaptor subunit [Cupriavidus sp. SW-Y-13]
MTAQTSPNPPSVPPAAPPATPAPAEVAANPRAVPRRRLIAVAALVAAAGIASATWWVDDGRFQASTDDAYVGGNIVQVTSLVPGTVVSIAADDTQRVTQGGQLIGLDPTDSEVALQQAAAQLAETVRQVRTLYANNGTLQADIAQRVANMENARDDLRRRMSVDGTGAVSKEDVDHAQSTLKAAQSALRAAQERLVSNQALTDHSTVAAHPEVMKAAALYRAAYLTHARSTLPAPVTGFVARRAVQVGQRVAPGEPLMGVVPLNQIWVDANFKENQMADMRVGQPVTLYSDFYGSHVQYSGKVAGFSAGTGAAFSVLPAQNATGNWIKVVQRLPVRIALDPAELAAHPLRLGLSMRATVDVHDHGGASLGKLPTVTPLSTDVYAAVGRDADASIARIIAANL